jgi:hypothetical protein
MMPLHFSSICSVLPAALWFTQPLTEMRTRNICGGGGGGVKRGRRVRLTILQSSVNRLCRKRGILNVSIQASTVCCRDSFTFLLLEGQRVLWVLPSATCMLVGLQVSGSRKRRLHYKVAFSKDYLGHQECAKQCERHRGT